MKAVFIDSENNTIKEVDIDGSLETMKKLINCNFLSSASVFFGDNNFLFVDDEGYLKDKFTFFKFKNMNTQWFAGNGLIIKEDECNEELTNHSINIDLLKENTIFMKCDNKESCPLPISKLIFF